jgi:uncharacterized protein (AIM24 family)
MATPFSPFAYRDINDTDMEFHIVGGEAQVLQVLVPPNKTVEAEPGALFYMSENIR